MRSVGDSFTLLQWNIQYGQAWDGADPDHAPADIAAVLEEIRRVDADIVLLQEVERVGPGGTRPEPPVNLQALRAGLPGYACHFDYPPANPMELPFGIGLAIFTRFALARTVSLALPAADIRFDFQGQTCRPTERLLIGATVQTPAGEVRVLNTHLQAYFMIGSSSDAHPQQRQMVESLLRAERGPALIGGDFNLAPGEGLVEQFARAGWRSLQTTRPTWKRRPYVTDHVFHNEGLSLLEHRVVETAASDHDMLWARLSRRG